MIVFGYRDGDIDRNLVAWPSVAAARAGHAPMIVKPVVGDDGEWTRGPNLYRVTDTPDTAPRPWDEYTLIRPGSGDVERVRSREMGPRGRRFADPSRDMWRVDIDGDGDRSILWTCGEWRWRVEPRANTRSVTHLPVRFETFNVDGDRTWDHETVGGDALADPATVRVDMWHDDGTGGDPDDYLTFERNRQGYWHVTGGGLDGSGWDVFPTGYKTLRDAINASAKRSEWVPVETD